MILFRTIIIVPARISAVNPSKTRRRFLASTSCFAMVSVLGEQCIVVHIYYLASNAYLYDLVLGKQGLPIQVLQIGEHVRMAIQYFASSVLIRTCTNYCTGSLGTPPKPRDHTSCELRVFTLQQS
jgi:hypothetical protein